MEFLTPSKKISNLTKLEGLSLFENLILVLVKEFFNVKLIEGLLGIWFSNLPQYLIKAILLGDFQQYDVKFILKWFISYYIIFVML